MFNVFKYILFGMNISQRRCESGNLSAEKSGALRIMEPNKELLEVGIAARRNNFSVPKRQTILQALLKSG